MESKRLLLIKRQKRCQACHQLFDPDPRTKGKQRYCSQESCQKKRQRKNERNWRRQNPKCLQRQYEFTRLWYKAHPDYSRRRREKDPYLLRANREQTRRRMQKIRQKRRFDKSKVILTLLADIKADKCYLARGYRWLHIRLTKASPLTASRLMWNNQANIKRILNRLPRGRLYDLSEEIFDPSKAGH